MRVRTLGGVLMAIGVAACCSMASGGVIGTVWIEVDNSVGTVGDAAGMETGLDGIRTFDLVLIVSPDTELFAADFGFAARVGENRSMWTTQPVYQNALGGDTQSKLAGALRTTDFAALEFDTFVSLGTISTDVVQNMVILGGDWSKSGFKIAWYPRLPGSGPLITATPDEFGHITLARVSVASERGFGDYTAGDEYLGGDFFISAEDDDERIGYFPREGVFYAGNAFDGPIPNYDASVPPDVGGGDDGDDTSDVGDGVDDSVVTPGPGDPPIDDSVDEPEELYFGDLNFDGAVDLSDLLILQQAYGTQNPFYDLDGDRIVEERDVHIMMYLITGEGSSSLLAGLTEKQLRKEEKRYQKVIKKIEKDAAKETKRVYRERKKAAKAAEKERKRLMKERDKERKRILKEQRKEQRRLEREARQNQNNQ